MSWRPEGWNNPSMGKVGGDLGSVFEAGADAMLEALRKEGISLKLLAYNDVEGYLRLGITKTKDFLEATERAQRTTGTLVVIPDD